MNDLDYLADTYTSWQKVTLKLARLIVGIDAIEQGERHRPLRAVPEAGIRSFRS